MRAPATSRMPDATTSAGGRGSLVFDVYSSARASRSVARDGSGAGVDTGVAIGACADPGPVPNFVCWLGVAGTVGRACVVGAGTRIGCGVGRGIGSARTELRLLHRLRRRGGRALRGTLLRVASVGEPVARFHSAMERRFHTACASAAVAPRRYPPRVKRNTGANTARHRWFAWISSTAAAHRRGCGNSRGA